jgi:hypothetical protein
MPEPGTNMAPGRRWRYMPPELAALIALQLAGAGAGVAAARAVGGGPARTAGGAVAGAAGPQQAGVRWLVLAGAVVLLLAVAVAAWWLIGDRYSSLSCMIASLWSLRAAALNDHKMPATRPV